MRVLLQGWRAPLHGYVEWLANPLLIIGWIATLRGYGRVAQATAWATVAAMLGFLFRHKLPLPGGGAITSYGPGYWLWVLSGLTLLLAQRRGLPGRSSTILSSEKSARIF
jgi:hypothetical protein